MGRIEKEGNEIVYKQDDGEITAYLTGFEEKMELGHEDTPKLKKILHIFVLVGFLYLSIIFLFF